MYGHIDEKTGELWALSPGYSCPLVLSTLQEESGRYEHVLRLSLLEFTKAAYQS